MRDVIIGAVNGAFLERTAPSDLSAHKHAILLLARDYLLTLLQSARAEDYGRRKRGAEEDTADDDLLGKHPRLE